MKRTVARQIAVRICFSEDFLKEEPESVLTAFFDPEHYSSLADDDPVFEERPDDTQMDYIRNLICRVYENIKEIDDRISACSEKRKIERIPKTALAVLRCAVCELIYFDDIPASVTINEAVEISKSFDSPETVSFINGVLGSVYRAVNESH